MLGLREASGTVKALRLNTRCLFAAIFAAAFALFLPLFAAAPAEAQVYYSIYGGYRNTPPQPYRDDRANPFVDFFGALFGGRPRYGDEDDKKPDAFAHHCVRTCDGKFFPVNRGGRKDLSLDKICSAMCPATQTKVFSGTGIEQSVASDGQRYQSMPNAFAYRTKIVDNCTCNGRDPFGVVTISPEQDLTLEGGDLVVMESGFTMYRGQNNFVPIEKAGMSPAFVKQLLAIKVLPNNPHATFAVTMPVSQAAPSVSAEDQPNRDPEIPSPNANAPASGTPARAN